MSSSRRSLALQCASEEETSELIFKLQALLPERNRRRLKRVSRNEVLEEICDYIRKLNREADDMSARVSQLLASVSHTTADADVLGTLLQH